LLNYSKGNIIMADINPLKAKVASQKTVVQQAVFLLDSIKAKIDAAIAANNVSLLAPLSSQISVNASELASVSQQVEESTAVLAAAVAGHPPVSLGPVFGDGPVPKPPVKTAPAPVPGVVANPVVPTVVVPHLAAPPVVHPITAMPVMPPPTVIAPVTVVAPAVKPV
jgi:hypothetical protein